MVPRESRGEADPTQATTPATSTWPSSPANELPRCTFHSHDATRARQTYISNELRRPRSLLSFLTLLVSLPTTFEPETIHFPSRVLDLSTLVCLGTSWANSSTTTSVSGRRTSGDTQVKGMSHANAWASSTTRQHLFWGPPTGFQPCPPVLFMPGYGSCSPPANTSCLPALSPPPSTAHFPDFMRVNERSYSRQSISLH